MQPIKRLAGSRKYSPVQRGLVRAFATGALRTNVRSRAAGYDVYTKCILCGQAEDTLSHRPYVCKGNPEIDEDRARILDGDRGFAARATDPENHVLYIHGLVKIPTGWPQPTSEILVKKLVRAEDGTLKEQAEEINIYMKGHLASDGSCTGGEICTTLARS